MDWGEITVTAGSEGTRALRIRLVGEEHIATNDGIGEELRFPSSAAAQLTELASKAE